MKIIIRLLLIFFYLSFCLSNQVFANTCVGRFLNPITDICWSCLFPITIGSIPLMQSSKFKDTPNPSMPVCFCNKGGIPMVPGLTVGFWEPVRIVEITRTPFCLVSLGGIKVMEGKKHGAFVKIRAEHDKRSKAYYNTHYYIYPVLALLNLLVDFGCMDISSYDLAYMSEFDPAYNSEKIANFMHPETFLLSNVAAKSACIGECSKIVATKLPQDSLFWCSGCQGSIYPFTGYIGNHIGGIASSNLLAVRQIAKLHRLGLARKTATNSSKPNGELCSSTYISRIPKSQYRLQLSYPIANVSGQYACNAPGALDALYSSGREFPYKGEDFAYILWRKRNCCLF